MPRAAKTSDGLTEKQARFVAEYLKTGNASAAYRVAYDARGMKPETVQKRAGELLNNGVITGCIATHRQQLREATQIDLESLTRALIEDRDAARADRNHQAAIAASRALMELHGLKTAERRNERTPFEGMTDEELLDGINRDMREAGVTIQ